MPLLYLDAIPRNTKRSTIVRLLVQVGRIDRSKVGGIEIRDRRATVEVPSDWLARLVKALDGANLAGRHIRCWSEGAATSTSQENHFQRLRRLLEQEAEAEAQEALRSLQRLSPQEAEQQGRSLCDLVIRDETVGLGGRRLVSLRKRQDAQLYRGRDSAPVHPFSSASKSSEKVRMAGEASSANERDRRSKSALSGSADLSEVEGSLRLDASFDEVSRRRQRQALERAEAASGDRLAAMRSVLLEERSPDFAKATDPSESAATLNEPQREAVDFCLSAEDVAIIHGPPGTGKTTTVVELIRQLVRRDQLVLACAPSNLAVDNVFERLLAAGEKAIRIGHPARVLPELRDRTLDLMVQSHPDMQIIRKLMRDSRELLDRASRFTRAKPAPGAKREMREQAKQMCADAIRMENQVVQAVLDEADVICATLTSLDSEVLGQRRFDVAVIDEACQCTEPACWIPLLRSDRLVLAGDHCQLPPTVVSADAMREGFNVSLMERMVAAHKSRIARLLQVQYRMHEQIMAFSSQQFYAGDLIADDAVCGHVLADLDGVESTDLTNDPLLFIDTAGGSYDEQPEPEGSSRLNPSEADFIKRLAEELLSAGVQPEDIAVIAPYSAQVRLLRELLSEYGQLEVDSVDGFQGREKEAVLLTLVRSNREGEIGFLKDTRRMNVALTRARRKLIVVGDSATIGGHSFYQSMLEYFEEQLAYQTIWQWS